MEKRPQTNNSNPNSKHTKKNNKSVEFEFCEVCNHNHNQGQRHKYFPNHTKSLATFLSRFQTKLDNVRFFLKNPRSLSTELSDRNQLWCVFCGFDVDELGSSFACGKMIRHLASSDHLKSLKNFLWRHGGAMDRIDSFTITESDLNKWEKKCEALKREVALASEKTPENLTGPVNGMRIARYRIHSSLKLRMTDMVHSAKRVANRGTGSQGAQPLNHLSSKSLDGSNGNVHSGAPPPWFEVNELSPTSRATSYVSPLSKPGKSNKLNPKRVGAAWAEKRKIELELERRGEIVSSKVDDIWLPNFGGVWQSGSRKESRKEFEMEKQKSRDVDSQTDMSVKIQPYISKRMRIDGDERL